MNRRSPYITALLVSALALAVADGVSTPRPRSGGRERLARSAALAGSSRPDQPCAWIEPDDQFHHELIDATGDLVFDMQRVAPPGGDDHLLLPVTPQVEPALTASLAAPPRPPRPALHPARRPHLGRGPPARLS